MLFSCKITHSVINYLDRRGEDLEALYEKCDWPAEFLRDPSCWLEADKMEAILRQIELDYGHGVLESSGDETLIMAVGHQCKDLRSWGVLDSVLRMVQTPKDLFAQPERFLSYFVSPAPPLGEIRRGGDSVSFVLPVSEEQFPLVIQYLRAALEGLPTYINKPMATVQWSESRIAISWSESQVSLFGESQNADLSLHPELVRNILVNLETTQSSLEEMKRQVHEKDQEIERLKLLLASAAAGHAPQAAPNMSGLAKGIALEIDEPVGRVLNELYRLGDYFARGQQLITLLVGQGRKTPQVQEAMRRVDWEQVAAESPKLVKRVVQSLQHVQETVRMGRVAADDEGPKVPSDLNVLLGRAIESVKMRFGEVNIDSHLQLDRAVPVFPSRMEQAMVNILSNTVESMQPGAVLRVATRPRGPRAQIEVSGSDSSGHVAGLSSGLFSSRESTYRAVGPLFALKAADAAGHGLSVAQSIVDMHDGSLTVSSESGIGSTVLVELPIEMPLTN